MVNVKKRFDGEDYQLIASVRKDVYDNCTYEDLQWALRDAIDIMRDSTDCRDKVVIVLEWE